MIVNESALQSENIIINLDNPNNGEPSHTLNPDGEPNAPNSDGNQLPTVNDDDEILGTEEVEKLFGLHTPGVADNNDGDRGV